VRDVPHLAEIQAARRTNNPPLRHQTRNNPKRAAEVCAGGSIYWVIAGAVQARQLVMEIIADVWDDGSPCCGLVLDTALVGVVPRTIRPFQGWRYLPVADAPPDVAAGAAGGDALPAEMRLALARLALL
jgi:hypothetical protein